MAEHEAGGQEAATPWCKAPRLVGCGRAKRRQRSNVWSFFYRQPSSDQRKAICFNCNSELSCKEGSTTSMRVHLRNHHPELYRTMLDMDDRQKQNRKGLEKLTLHNDHGLRTALTDTFKSEGYSDLTVICGVDGGTIKSHRIILATLSPFIHDILAEEEMTCSAAHDCVISLPDVDSKVLSHFLFNACSGPDEEAVVDDSLSYLGFASEAGIHNYDHIDDIWVRPELELLTSSSVEHDDMDGTEVHDEERSQFGAVEDEEPQDNDHLLLDVEWSARRQKRKKRSLTWRYFDKIDALLASCKTCHFIVKTEKGNTSGMSSHLKSLHPNLYSQLKSSREANESFMETTSSCSAAETPIESIGACRGDQGQPPRRKKRSLVWNYFMKHNSMMAICLTCHCNVKTEMGNTTGMANHLRGNHPQLYEELQLSRQQQQQLQHADPHLEAMPADYLPDDSQWSDSPGWQFIQQVEDHQFKCSQCDFMFRSPLQQPFLEHLRIHHSTLYEHSIKGKLLQSQLSASSNPIWAFFDLSHESKSCSASCKECHDEIPNPEMTVGPLKRHLEEHHSDSFLELEEKAHGQLRSAPPDKQKKAPKVKSPGARAIRSAVWNYFEKTEVKGKNQCITCGKVLTCQQQNTTNMIRHLEFRHRDLFRRFLLESGGGLEPEANSKALVSSDPMRCNKCERVFACRQTMLAHQKSVHCDPLPTDHDDKAGAKARYLCSFCGHTFDLAGARDRHEKIHRGGKGHVCDVCRKCFMTNQQLNKHLRIHSEKKPFECTQCGSQFAFVQQLTTHQCVSQTSRSKACAEGSSSQQCHQRLSFERTVGSQPLHSHDSTSLPLHHLAS